MHVTLQTLSVNPAKVHERFCPVQDSGINRDDRNQRWASRTGGIDSIRDFRGNGMGRHVRPQAERDTEVLYSAGGRDGPLGVGLNYAGLNTVQMLFWSAVVNGVLAPPLIVLVVLLTSDRSVMGDHVSPPLLKWLGWITAGVMTAAAVAMFVAG